MDCGVYNVSHLLLKLHNMHFTNYFTFWVHIYSCIFVHSVCPSENKLDAVFMHHCLSFWSISAREQQSAVFSLPLSVPWHIRSTTNSSICRQCSCMSSLSWPNRYFYLCPVSMPPLARTGYVGAAYPVRCHPPFSLAVAE